MQRFSIFVRQLNALIEVFIPPPFRIDPSMSRRARILVFIGGTLPLFSPSMTNRMLESGSPPLLAYAPVLTAAIAFSSLFVLKFTRSLALAAHVFLSALFVNAVIGSYFDGGLSSAMSVPLTVAPFMAIWFLGIRRSVVWLLLCSATLSAFFLMQLKGFSFPHMVPEPFRSQGRFILLIGTSLILWYFSVTYEKVQDQSFKMAKDRADELEKLNRVIMEQQQKLIHSAKMAALGEIAGGIAHEINNPLAMINLNADQLQILARRSELDSKNVLKATTRIHELVARMATIVRGLILFARGSEADPMEVISVRRIISETLQLCQEKIKKAGVRFQVDDVPPHLSVSCRFAQVEQVLLNLLMNACEAVEAKTEKDVKLQVRWQSDAVEILVSDSGSGVPEDIREKIFQPFFTTKAVGKGTGLGLSLSKGIVESHHGSLSLLDQRPTTFVLQLPLA